eukprot:TRINITY_DN76756_c0_g1_i1.p1 TRINITY_DN76756_c0_g1~~TRINITY_DN76756_c0_g1_i1.p1  ORF type:complete len:271 (+),score=80.75 TRINITY_DN76756_c0_g1_i1:29-841(+)
MSRASADQELVRSLFKRYDKDGNGMLEPKEFKKVFVELGIAKNDAALLFQVLDKDENSAIDFDELLNWLFSTGDAQKDRKSVFLEADSWGLQEDELLETSDKAAARIRHYEEVIDESKKKRKSKGKDPFHGHAMSAEDALKLRWDGENVLADELQKQFKLYDVDQSGSLSRDELVKIARVMDAHLVKMRDDAGIDIGRMRSDAELVKETYDLFNSLDCNGDDSVSIKEFVKVMIKDLKKEEPSSHLALSRVQTLTKTLSEAIKEVRRAAS